MGEPVDRWSRRREGRSLLIGHPSLVNRRGGSSRRVLRGSPRGVIYPILLLGILIIGLASAGVAEVWSTQVKREKEEELLFRLQEFRQAIARYRAAHSRPPKELKDLLEDRSTLVLRHYLRRIYPDPMTGKADWKLDLQVDRAGVVSGITDVHSQSKEKPLKVLVSIKPITSYQDW